MKGRLFLIAMLLFATQKTNAQTQDANTLIAGKWKFEQFTSTDSSEIDSNIIAESKGVTVLFKNGVFITKRNVNKKEVFMGTGKYSISADGNFLIQDNVEHLIKKLTATELIIMATDQLIMKFIRP